MKTTHASSLARWCFILMMHSSCGCTQTSLFQFRYVFQQRHHVTHRPPSQSSAISPNMNSRRRRSSFSLGLSTIDADIPDEHEGGNKKYRKNSPEQQRNSADSTILSWNDILPLSMYATACVVAAILVSTYEDYDVTHTRPSPSTLRLPTVISSESIPSSSSWRRSFNFIGAATRGMGWGPSDRDSIPSSTTLVSEDTYKIYSFEDWYGTSATTLQWKPSYNEIMLQHRLERVPRWNELGNKQSTTSTSTQNNMTPTKEQLKQAVLQLHHSLEEIEKLKAMAEDYMWEEMKDHLSPTPNTLAIRTKSDYPLPLALEYSMDILKSIASYYSSSSIDHSTMSKRYLNMDELPNLIGFDWGSCAWRHCGAKADAQEAIAELYSNVGMLEPFECQFILDVVERSIRDVLDVVPDEFKPYENGVLVRLKPYKPYVSHGGSNEDGMGIDYEYTKALSEVRVDLSTE